MARESKLVALMFERNGDRLVVVGTNSEKSRKRIGIKIDESHERWKYGEGQYLPIGRHRYFELGKRVKGVVGVYDSANVRHLSTMVEDSAYAKLIKFERQNDHD
jgi:hypothetical protein